MKAIKNIGIMTSGGDCGGLNAVIKGAGAMAKKMGLTGFIIPNGYAGLYNLMDFEKLTALTTERLDIINSAMAGSAAGHSRVKIKKIEDAKKYDRIKEGLKKFSIDALVISGGDDSGSVLVDLCKHGIDCVHVPKTMDLDLQTYSVGGDSTINKISVYLDELKTTGRTHNRVIVVEVFGRYAGHTAFRSGIAADADAVLIPEIPVDFNELYLHVKQKLTERITTSDVHDGTYIIVVAEGMKNAGGEEIVDKSAGMDAFGHKKLAGSGKYVCRELTKRFKADNEISAFMKETHLFVENIYEVPEVRAVTPGHLVRCGRTSAYDANFGKEAGGGAVVLLKNGITGVTIVGVNGSEIRYMDAEKAIKQRYVDLKQVRFHEQLGVCFGRKVEAYKAELKKMETSPERYM